MINENANQKSVITYCEEYISPTYYEKKDVLMVHLIATTESGLSVDIDVSKTFNKDSKLTQLLCAIYKIGWRQVYAHYGNESLDCLIDKPFLADVHAKDLSVVTGEATYYIDNIRPMPDESEKEGDQHE